MLSLSRIASTWFAGLCLLSGCGYVGLEDGPRVALDGLGGAQSATGGAKNGGAGTEDGLDPGEKSSGGRTSPGKGGIGEGGSSTGGRQPGTGGDNAGTGGELGTGGSIAIPSHPCATDCAAPFLLYRSFELGIPVVPQTTGGGEVERDSDVVYQGGDSMRFTQDIPGSRASIGEEIRMVSSGTIYLRSWVLIPDGSVNDWTTLFSFNGEALKGIDTNLRLGQIIDSHVHTALRLKSSEGGAYPVDSWFCLQVAIDVDDASGSVKVAVNGETVLTQENIDTKPDQGINHVAYGINATGLFQTGASVYLDEVVVSQKPVACD